MTSVIVFYYLKIEEEREKKGREKKEREKKERSRKKRYYYFRGDVKMKLN